MSRILTPARRVYVTEHEYHFDSLEHPGSGYCFDSSESRQPVCHTPVQEQSLATARQLVSAGKMRERGYTTYERSYWEEAELACDCGNTIVLYDSLTNECERCRRLYNGSGQQLAPMSQWEPEDVYAALGPRNAPEDY